MQRQKYFDLVPWGPGEGSKIQISFNFNYKVSSKDFFLPNFVCNLTNERYKAYQMEFSFFRQGNALGVGLGLLRVQIYNSVCPTVMLKFGV